MNKKKKIIVTSIIVGIVVCLFICVFAVMSVKDTKINFLYSSDLNQDEIVAQLNEQNVIPYGTSVLSINKGEIAQKIEKVCPVLKVYGIEFVFPGTIKINCKERINLLYVPTGEGQCCVLDSEFKVLYTTTEAQAQAKTLTKLGFDESVFNGQGTVGSMLDFNYYQDCFDLFASVVSRFEYVTMFSNYFTEIQINQGTINGTSQKCAKVLFKTQLGKTVEFENPTENMQERVNKLFDIVTGQVVVSEDYIILSY